MRTTPPPGVMNIYPEASGRLPPSFHVLSNRDVQDYYQNIINEWKPLSDVWSIRIAPYVVHALTVGSALYINTLFRRRLKLRFQGYMLSVVTVGGLATLTFGLADSMSRKKILENAYCPVCMEIRYAAFYAGCGVLHPLIASPLVNLHIAAQYGFMVPNLHQYREIFSYWWSAVKPAGPRLLSLVCAYGLLGLVISRFTMESVHFVHYIIARMHRDYLRNYEEVIKRKEEKEATVE